MNIPSDRSFGKLIPVHHFFDEMPTGVTISEDNRIFINFPEWGDDVKATVVELVNDQLVPYPSKLANQFDENDPLNTLLSVQSVVADGHGTLWILDTAAPEFASPLQSAAKLMAVDLRSNTIKRSYTFPSEVVLDTTYLNDVRIDLNRNVAYITDSSIKGPGAIIILYLDSGDSFRILDGALSTSADVQFLPKVEGEILMNRPIEGPSNLWEVAADGIALSPNGDELFFSPLSSRHLYSLMTEYIFDGNINLFDLEAKVKDWGEKGASDGMITDKEGNIYAGDYENNSIRRINKDGSIDTIVHDPRILWPDTLSISTDDYLYFNVNQLQRQSGFHKGVDLREKPYTLFKIYIGDK